jgi:hypothetical protein
MKLTDFVTGVVVPLVTAITGIFVFSLDSRVKTFEGQLKVREANRLDTADQRQSAQQQADLRFRIYEAATKSLESNDARNQQVATSLVIAMLEPSDPLRSGLLEVLKSHAEPDVKKEAETALQESSQFIAQQTLAPVAPATVSNDDWRAYNLDVFWCAAVGSSAKDKADRIGQALRSAGSKGRLRVRELGPTINASPGYRISGLMIRREENEESVAEAVKKISDSAAGDSVGFLLTNSSQGTPGYMSLFVCQ